MNERREAIDNGSYLRVIPATLAIPARAGIQEIRRVLDSRFRGNDDQGGIESVLEFLSHYTGN